MHTSTARSGATQQSENARLFSPLTIRGVTLKNRIAMSPMCQYSSIDGMATDWHYVHLGSRAVGGCALVMVEATAVEARGRISPEDMGLWEDRQIEPLEKITAFISQQNCVPAIQLAHAGRKACTRRPWDGGGPIQEGERDYWRAVAPSAIPFDEGYQTPHALSEDEIAAVVQSFRAAARRAVQAGFRVIEIHSAHGYLLHEFLSPISNTRTDKYGGILENRTRALLQVTDAVRAEMPQEMPLFVRISATDWVADGWDIQESTILSLKLKEHGVDLIDCSSGGSVPHAQIPATPGYQVPFAEVIRKDASIMTGAVGLIKKPEQAEDIIAGGKADIVLLGRELLRDPYWPLHAAKQLGAETVWPPQYQRARN